MKTWQSFALWPVLAILFELVAISFSVGPPLSGWSLVAAHILFASFVLLGPFGLFEFSEFFTREPLLIVGLFSGGMAVGVLIYNRNRKKILNVVAGFLWCGAGAISLWVRILFTI